MKGRTQVLFNQLKKLSNEDSNHLIDISLIDNNKIFNLNENKSYFKNKKADIINFIDFINKTQYSLYLKDLTMFIDNHFDKIINFIYENKSKYLRPDPYIEFTGLKEFKMEINIWSLHYQWFAGNFNDYKNLLKSVKNTQIGNKQAEKLQENNEIKDTLEQAEKTKSRQADDITELKDKLKNKKTKKKKAEPKYRNNKNTYSWEDVIIVNVESTGQFSYQTIKELKSFGLSKKRKELLYLILKSDGIQQDYDFKHNKNDFRRLNNDLMQMFNKLEKPIEWHKGKRVYEVKFKFKIFSDSVDYKTTLLTPEIESKLQCNLNKMEN